MSNGAIIAILMAVFVVCLLGAWSETSAPAGSPTSAYERLQSEIG